MNTIFTGSAIEGNTEMKIIKTDEVEKRVAKLASLVGQKDGEAHRLEDDLFLDVLKAIASGAPNPRKLAAAAIKSADLDLERWYE